MMSNIQVTEATKIATSMAGAKFLTNATEAELLINAKTYKYDFL